MVTRLWYRSKDINFETKFLFGMHQMLQGHSFLVRGRHGHFEWLAFDTDYRFFDFKINFFFDFLSSASRLLIISRVKICSLW